jgi:hypothetical protein
MVVVAGAEADQHDLAVFRHTSWLAFASFIEKPTPV